LELETGDILFIRGNGEFSFLIIKRLLNSEFSHVAIVVEKKLIFEVNYKQIQIIENPYKKYELFRIKTGLTKIQKEQIKKFLYAKCLVNEGYDWWRIVSFAFEKFLKYHLVIHRPNRYICSEIIDKAFQQIGIDLVLNRVTGDVTPVHLLTSDLLVRKK
jgi:hypothetical protein